jgi:hypothetical protein
MQEIQSKGKEAQVQRGWASARLDGSVDGPASVPCGIELAGGAVRDHPRREPMIVRRVARVAFTAGAVAIAACGKAPPPDGRTALEAARAAMAQVDRFTMTRSWSTDLGTYTRHYQVDCASGYYHGLATSALTAEGVRRGSTQTQGRPAAQQKHEELHVAGRSFDRHSGHWEDPLLNDSPWQWAPRGEQHGARADCSRIRAEEDLMGLPLSKIAVARSIDFVERRSVDGAECDEYRMVYEDEVWGDLVAVRDDGHGSRSSERERIPKELEASLCVGSSDGRVYRAETTSEFLVGETRQFSYDDFERLSAPVP